MEYPKSLGDLFAGTSESLSVQKSGPGSLAFAALRCLEQGLPAVVVVPGGVELARLHGLFSLLAPPERPGQAPTLWRSLPSFAPGPPSPAFWAKRTAFLHFARFGPRARLLLCTVDNFLPKWPATDFLDGNTLLLAQGDELPREMLLEQLVSWGYRRGAMATAPGEFAARGDIVDVFAAGSEMPSRLEFFGDALESLREFDPVTQRSQAPRPSLLLLPVLPVVHSPERKVRAEALWDAIRATGELSPAAREALSRKLLAGDGAIHPGLFYDKPARFTDWLPEGAVTFLHDADLLRARLEEVEFAWRRSQEAEAAEAGFPWPAARLTWPLEMARKACFAGRHVLFERLVMGRAKTGLDLPEKKIERFVDLFWKPGSDRRPWTTLVAALHEWAGAGRAVILSFHGERSRKKFLKMAEPEGLVFRTAYRPGERGLFALVSPLRQGMELLWADTLVLTEDALFPESDSRARPKTETGRFKGLTAFDEIRQGDLVVHRDYGLCAFEGLSRMTVDNAGGDYLLLTFADDDKVYLPADKMGLIQRYKGPEGQHPALDRLGGSKWKSVRERAKKAIEKIAEDLVEMYAYRKVAKGYAYGPLNELYWEFETTFGFEETPDQERAIADVLADMERPEPMDRLVCGDVGFGKTEVALRAAFRAVLDGKQVVMLCPTTVLAEQHYQNFTARLDGFPVRVGMLSRFVPPKQRKAVVEGMKKGQIDILVGTHRLLSKDVEAPNLGLLILDEEQRFGVKHKERLKSFRKNIDVLTLTATPIPRTLQLSLSGIRGLSVIETPPAERKPVETALIERDPDFLRRVLRHEIERGGQVFWVHNRIQGLERTVEFIRSLVPEARVGMAHGQMVETALETAMHQFWHGEIDILACTAIIESGLDFPRANTLIVDQAHMFGLGQLYQLRGRVGRSPVKAYAYFLVPSLDGVPETARDRLRVVQDMDYLGAGFQVAMEDLRLRGAGNILGESQSGHIARVGLDMFLAMLDQEVKRLRGEKIRERVDPEVTLSVPARIPERYVADSRERLGLYKALSSAQNEQALVEIAAEMRDRFGALPEETETFLAVMALKQVLSRLEAAKADIAPGRLVVTWDGPTEAVSAERLIAWIGQGGDGSRMLSPAKLELRFKPGEALPRALGRAGEELARLTEDTQGAG